jgi:hypothetical protein
MKLVLKKSLFVIAILIFSTVSYSQTRSDLKLWYKTPSGIAEVPMHVEPAAEPIISMVSNLQKITIL